MPSKWHCSQTFSHRWGFEINRVNDIHILTGLDGVPGVQLAGPVAPFTADRQPVKDRRFSLYPVESIGVAEEAACSDRSVGVLVSLFVARRQVPFLLLRIPGIGDWKRPPPRSTRKEYPRVPDPIT